MQPKLERKISPGSRLTIIIIIIIKGIYIAQVRKGHKCAVGRDGSMVIQLWLISIRQSCKGYYARIYDGRITSEEPGLTIIYDIILTDPFTPILLSLPASSLSSRL